MPSIHHGIEVPDLTDPPNAPAQLRALVDSGGAVPRFPTLAAARTAYPDGQRPAGMLVGVGTRLYTSNGTDFVSVAAGGVENFANAAERQAEIANPAINQLTTLSDTVGVLWAWTGARWVPIIQARQQVVTANSSGGYSITFPVPFAAPPTVMITDYYSGATRLLVHALINGQVTATGFGAVIRDVGPGTVWNGGNAMHWLATARTL